MAGSAKNSGLEFLMHENGGISLMDLLMHQTGYGIAVGQADGLSYKVDFTFSLPARSSGKIVSEKPQ